MTASLAVPETTVDLMLDIARRAARNATCPRAQVGAVIARGDDVLSIGWNDTPGHLPECEHPITQPCGQTVHAERMAVDLAAKAGRAIDRAVLYTTLSPCVDCAGSAITAGLRGVVYLEPYRDTLGIDLLLAAGVPTVQA